MAIKVEWLTSLSYVFVIAFLDLTVHNVHSILNILN